MNRYYYIIIFIFFTSLIHAQEIEDAIDFLDKIESVAHIDTTESDYNISVIETTDYSLKFNGKEFYDGIYQDEIIKDSSLNYLRRADVGTITIIKEDSIVILNKMIFVDTLLSYRIAAVGLQSNKYNIDSIFNSVRTQLSSGIKWNQLNIHHTEQLTEIKGDWGWFSQGTMISKFESKLDMYKKGDIFLVNIELNDIKMSYIIYKIENSRYFKRNTSVQIVVSNKT